MPHSPAVAAAQSVPHKPAQSGDPDVPDSGKTEGVDWRERLEAFVSESVRFLDLLDGVRHTADLGAEVAPGLHERELRHLMTHEWARTADDVLWRRSKLGLHLDAAGREAVARWLTSVRPQ